MISIANMKNEYVKRDQKAVILQLCFEVMKRASESETKGGIIAGHRMPMRSRPRPQSIEAAVATSKALSTRPRACRHPE